MQDLDIRGAGNLLGGEQSGFIADIGFETYQKILNEAIAELREEEFAKTGETPGEKAPPQPAHVHLRHADRHRPRSLYPGRLHQQSAEKIRLYRELDHITDDRRLALFEKNLIDRFGPVPEATRELFDIVRMRWVCIELGFEKAIVKNGIMILKFIENQHSAYYKSTVFGNILKIATRTDSKFIFNRTNNNAVYCS